MRKNDGLLAFHQYQLTDFTRSLTKVSKFCNAFDLNLKSELFSIRDQLQKQSNDAKAKYTETNKATKQAGKIFHMDPGDIDKYNNYRKMRQELKYYDKKNFQTFRNLVNYEYFLKKYRYIKDHDEIESINNKYDEINLLEPDYEWDELK